MREVIILRGTSSSGKSTFANLIEVIYPDVVICCADDFFYQGGNYVFDRSKLGEAHMLCKQKFEKAICDDENLILVANTNTNSKAFNFYKKMAESFGYRVTFLVVEKRHENSNSHNCPEPTIRMQAEEIKNSLKLF